MINTIMEADPPAREMIKRVDKLMQMIPRSHFDYQRQEWGEVHNKKLDADEMTIKENQIHKMQQVAVLLASVMKTARRLEAHDLFAISTLRVLAAEIAQATCRQELALCAKYFLDFALSIAENGLRIGCNVRIADRADLMSEIVTELLHRMKLQ